MPKTRRGGRKYRARQQLLKLTTAPATARDSQYLGVESNYDKEYEQLFEFQRTIGMSSTRRDNNNNSSDRESIKWPRKLIPITIERTWLPPFDIKKEDPRRARYLEIRAEILHTQYDGATPAHWKAAQNPVRID